MTKNRFFRIYALGGILLPILFQYSTSITGFTIGDLILVSLLLIMIIFIKKIAYSKVFVIINIYILFSLVGLIFQNKYETSIMLTTIRYLCYISYIIFLPNVISEKKYICNMYRKIVLFISTFLIIQYILLKIGNLYLPGVIQFFRLTDTSLYNYSYVITYINSGRCMSVFSEPSHFVIYVLPSLILCLFDLKKIRYANIIEALFLSFSIILCSSFTGIAGMSVVWIMWFTINIKNGNFSFRFILFFSICIFLILYILYFTQIGSYIINPEIYTRQSSGRFEGFEYIKQLDRSFFERIFGSGMKDIGEEIYLSGWPRLLFYFGYFGTTLYSFSLITFIKNKMMSNIIISLLFVLMIGTEIIFTPFFVLYMILINVMSNKKIFSNQISE